MSRHQIDVAAPPRLLHVATSNQCRDIVSPAQPKPGCDIKTRSRPSLRRTYVVTSISCRDLPHIGSCRDIKSMSRRCFCPTKAHKVATPLPVATSKLGRDLVLEISSSHSSFCLAQKKKIFFFFQTPPVAFPATPKDAVACTLLFTHFKISRT